MGILNPRPKPQPHRTRQSTGLKQVALLGGTLSTPMNGLKNSSPAAFSLRSASGQKQLSSGLRLHKGVGWGSDDSHGSTLHRYVSRWDVSIIKI
jgi:hypothetical protein